MFKVLSLGLITVTCLFTTLPSHRVLPQGDADTRAEVRRLLKEATELALQIDSPLDRAVVFARIGSASWRAGDNVTAAESFDKALKIVDALPQESPDQDRRDTYRAGIAGTRAQAGDILGAQQTLSLITSDSEKISTLSDIAIAQARAKQFTDAVHTASAIQDPDFRDQNFEWIANLQAEAGDAQGAAQLAHNIKSAQYRAKALARIAALNGDGGRTEEARIGIQEALGAAEHAEANGGRHGRSSHAACASEEAEQPRDAALERIAVTQARIGDIAGALETINRMHDKTGREDTLATIAEHQARIGDLAGARASIAAISRDGCKEAALGRVAMGQFEAGSLSAALLTVNGMKDPEQKASILTSLGEQVVKQGAFDSAMEILGRARGAARQIAEDSDRAFMLESISRIQAKAGSRDEAAKTLAEAVPAAIAAHEWAKREQAWTGALPDLIEQQAEMGDLDGAWAALAHLDESDRIHVVQNAARAQSRTGDVQGALTWAARQVSARDKALALVGVAEGVLVRQESEKE